jgi:hypothetical protein
MSLTAAYKNKWPHTSLYAATPQRGKTTWSHVVKQALISYRFFSRIKDV